MNFKNSPGALGILGMNRRNACYTLRYNARALYPLVDDKLKTKQLLEENNLPAPELYFSLSQNFELKLLKEISSLKEFVVKPSRGAGGRGILVIVDKKGERWIKASGETISMEDLEYHVSNILAGLYSLGGTDDRAFLEYCVRSHAQFRKVAYQGVPDIRVLLYRGVPAMSMLRLPTKESDGKANLHQGAIGVGINMAEGRTLGGVHRDRMIDHHPDTGAAISELRIPFWEDILETAARIFDVFKLGYMGVDFVIDHLLGPLILELNARPGLSIQLANRAGLRLRLDAIDGLGSEVETLSWKSRLEASSKLFQKFEPLSVS